MAQEKGCIELWPLIIMTLQFSIEVSTTVLDNYQSKMHTIADTKENLTPLLVKRLDGFYIAGKNIWNDIHRLTQMGITWPIINVDGHIHHSVKRHDTEEDARGVMLILVSLCI